MISERSDDEVKHEVTVTYTPEICREAAWLFCRTYFGWKLLLGVVALAAVTVYLLSTGNTSWYVWLLTILLGFSVCVVPLLYRNLVASSLSYLEHMKTPRITFLFDEDQVVSIGRLGQTDIIWSNFNKVSRSSKVWLLFTGPADYLTLPTEALNEEVRELIERKVGN